MSFIAELIRNFKPAYSAYNLLHTSQLQHNREAYNRYGIKKPLFAGISSADFKNLPPTAPPWLDNPDEMWVEQQIAQAQIPEEQREQLRFWRKNGYLILPKFLDENQVESINTEVNRLLSAKSVAFNNYGKIMFAHKKSAIINSHIAQKYLTNLLEILLGKPVIPFQTINFRQGSQQRAHSDSIHMSTYPAGFLAAAWFALEKVDADNGALFYYPGTHRLPYLFNDGYEHGGNNLLLGKHAYKAYENRLEEILQEQKLDPQTFHANPGDVLIWHANLVHGGMPINDPKRTRQSMVAHYFAEGVIKYHEITQRPALL